MRVNKRLRVVVVVVARAVFVSLRDGPLDITGLGGGGGRVGNFLVREFFIKTRLSARIFLVFRYHR